VFIPGKLASDDATDGKSTHTTAHSSEESVAYDHQNVKSRFGSYG